MLVSFIKYFIITALVFSLSACGGGTTTSGANALAISNSSSTASQRASLQQEQTQSPTDGEIVASPGTDAVTEESSNNTLAKVDSQGLTIAMSAWVGKHDSLISFPATANGFTFYSSRTSDCDLAHVANCSYGQFALLQGASITDTATTLEYEGFYVLKNQNDQASLRMVSKESFAPRAEHQVVNFNNALWLVGGYLGLPNFETPDLRNDVWQSNDAISWTEQTDNAGFSTRTGHQLVVFKNALWLIGGNDSKVDYLIPGDDNGRKNDIWSSVDGIHWTQQVTHAAFSPRSNHQVVSFNGKLWLMGGDDKDGDARDLWSSSNGITWIKHTSPPDFPANASHKVAVLNNKLWLIGDSGNHVWASSDGVSWAKQTLNISFTARSDHQVITHNNKLWVMGGYQDNAAKTDLWSSADGLTWTLQNAHTDLPVAQGYQLLSFNNRLVVIGGYTQSGFSNEIWSSDQGVEWRKGFSGTFQFPQ